MARMVVLDATTPAMSVLLIPHADHSWQACGQHEIAHAASNANCFERLSLVAVRSKISNPTWLCAA